MQVTAGGRQREVGVRASGLDAVVRRQLNIPLDRDRLTPDDRALLAEVHRTHDTDDVTPMNVAYGPISGMSEGERVLRAYRLGLLRERSGPPPGPPRAAG